MDGLFLKPVGWCVQVRYCLSLGLYVLWENKIQIGWLVDKDLWFESKVLCILLISQDLTFDFMLLISAINHPIISDPTMRSSEGRAFVGFPMGRWFECWWRKSRVLFSGPTCFHCLHQLAGRVDERAATPFAKSTASQSSQFQRLVGRRFQEIILQCSYLGSVVFLYIIPWTIPKILARAVGCCAVEHRWSSSLYTWAM